MAGEKQNLTNLRQRVFKMVSVGIIDDRINQGYDVISTAMLLINLVGAFAGTFDNIALQHGELLKQIEAVTVAFFALDYILRVYTAPCLYPDHTGSQPYLKYALSGAGIIDLLSFLRILRFSECNFRGYYQQGTAALVLSFHYFCSDAGIQSGHVFD